MFLTPVFLRHLLLQVIEHHRTRTGRTDGHVLCFLHPVDAHEHASTVSYHYHRSARGPTVQVLPPMVRRNLFGLRNG